MFFLPYKDDNPTRSFPIVNWLIIAGNLWVFFAWQFPLGPSQQAAYFSSFGFIPATFFGNLMQPSIQGTGWEWFTHFPPCLVMVELLIFWATCLFYLYGDNLEDALGKIRYLIFYLGCGLLPRYSPSLIRFRKSPWWVHLSGVIGGYLLLYPRANIRVFYWIILFIGRIMVPAYLVLGIWVAEQILLFPESMKEAGGVAIAAHLGGFGAGFILTPFFKKKGVRLFQDGHSRPFTRQQRRIR